MKNYLIIDLNSDWRKVANYQDVKDLLIEELKNDLFDNYEERDIVESNVKILCSLASDKLFLNDIKKELECYSYKVIDLLKLQRDLEDIKNYFENNLEYYGKIDEVINIINKGVDTK